MRIELKRFSTNRKFGVELEVSNNLNLNLVSNAVKASGTKKKVLSTDSWASTDTNVGLEYWQVKKDSTCGPKGKTKNKALYGYEVASYVASGRNGLVDVSNVATSLKKYGAEVTKYCGFHIHADARDLSNAEVGNILAQWLKIEAMLFQAVPESRRNNKYCKSLYHRKFKGKALKPNYSSNDIWNLIKPNNVGVHDNPEKKYTLNSVGYAAAIGGYYDGKHTLELRLPEGTLDRNTVKNWIRLFINFIDVAKNATLPEDFKPANVYQTLQILGLQGTDDAFYMLSEGLYETKVWFLGRLCQYASKLSVKKEAKKILAYIT